MLTTIMSIVFLAAVPTNQPVGAMSLDDLRREVAALRRENDLLRDRLAKLEAADEPVIDDEPKLSIRDAIKAGKVQEGMSISQAKAAMKGASDQAMVRDGRKATYTWVWVKQKSVPYFKNQMALETYKHNNPGMRIPGPRTETVVVRTVTATAMDGKIVSVEDVAGE